MAAGGTLGERVLPLLDGTAREAAGRPHAPLEPGRGALVTIGSGPHEELTEITRPVLDRYAAKHGLDLYVVSELAAPQRAASWSKIAVLRDLLDGYARVGWIDADAVVVDGRADLTREATHRQPFAVVTHRYDGLTVPNLGVIALRRSRVTLRTLEQLWRMTQYAEHKWWENAAMLELLGFDVDRPTADSRRFRPLSLRVRELDVAWNSIDLDPSPAPCIVHFPGTAHAERVERLTELAHASLNAGWA